MPRCIKVIVADYIIGTAYRSDVFRCGGCTADRILAFAVEGYAWGNNWFINLAVANPLPTLGSLSEPGYSRPNSSKIMSLFGESPPATSSFGASASASAHSKSLFGDEPTASNRDSASSLFAENANDSPWSMPTPKKSARQNIVKTLLPATQVPDSYVDAYDLLTSGESRGSGVSLTAVRKILESSRLGASDQERILNLLLPTGRDSASSLERGEFNVLLALIGLGQEGEEVTLDSVDERRKRELPGVHALWHATADRRQVYLNHKSPSLPN